MTLCVYRITEDATLELLPDQQLSASWPLDPVHRWIDIENPETSELEELLSPLELPQQILEACLRNERGTRLISRRNALYLELSSHLGWDQIQKPYLSVLCLKTTIITIHHDLSHSIKDVIQGIDLHSPLVANTSFAVLIHLLIEIGKQNVSAALDIRTEAEILDQTYSDRADEINPQIIANLRRRISHCDAVHDNNSYCGAVLLTVETDVFHGIRQPTYLKNILHLTDLTQQLISGARERVAGVQEDYELALQHRVENRLRFLTILSAVFLPLTLISAVYGMNFNDLPAMHLPYGYLVVIGLMIGTAGVTAGILYWRGWFE